MPTTRLPVIRPSTGSEVARRAVILAGGKGSRLAPFTFAIPKPLVPIGDLPIVEILIRQLVAAGYDRITISVGHLAGLIQAFCGDGAKWGVGIDYVREDEPLGTIGCLALIDDIEEDRLLIVNGDTLTTMDLAMPFDSHDPGDALTICANRRTVDIEFGVLHFDDVGLLTEYEEKPRLGYDVSMGVNIVSTWVVGKYIDGSRRDLPELVRVLQAEGEAVRVLPIDAYWLDLGRIDDLEAGTKAFEADPSRFLPR